MHFTTSIIDLNGTPKSPHYFSRRVNALWFQEPISKRMIKFMVHESPERPLRIETVNIISMTEDAAQVEAEIEHCYLMSVDRDQLMMLLKSQYCDEKQLNGLVLAKEDIPMDRPDWPFQYIQLKAMLRDYQSMQIVVEDFKVTFGKEKLFNDKSFQGLIPFAVKPIDPFQFTVGARHNKEVIFDIRKEYNWRNYETK